MKIQKNINLLFICILLVLAIILPVNLHTADTALADSAPEEKLGIFSAYTADEAQTDSSPTITASNKTVQEGFIANNCLPFGTKIRVNGKIFEVQDRMNKRYGCDNFDIFMNEYSEAINFGRQTIKYEII
jgi:3D (Asp-Asp-Asp) domain-containing protein